jgi:hypothetical protein
MAIAPVDMSVFTWFRCVSYYLAGTGRRTKSCALVMHHGRGNLFDDINLALQVYNDL